MYIFECIYIYIYILNCILLSAIGREKSSWLLFDILFVYTEKLHIIGVILHIIAYKEC